MRLIPPRQTDAIASLAARVSALEGASYDTNSPVSMYKLFTETPKALDDFTIFTHPYHVCGTSLDVEADYPQLILGAKPVAYYRMDETSGTTVHDLSGNGNNGTINGGVTLGQPGAIADGDTAMKFDGSTGYTNSPNSNSLNITTPTLSMEAWVYLTNANGGIIANKENQYEFGIGSPAGGSGTSVGVAVQTVGSENGTAGGGWYWVVTNAQLTQNAWHHVVTVYNGSNIIIYVDSVQQTTTASGATGNVRGNTNSFDIGARSQTSPSGFFSGTIDEVAIYNYALSADEVQRHYNAGHIAPLFV